MSEFDLAVAAENVIKIYEHKLDSTKISALQGCDLFVNRGELISVIGPSGAGKSTLLRLLAGVEQASSGQIIIGGIPIQNWDDTRRREFRRKFIGTFSQHARENLDPKMSVADAIRWELLNAQWKPNRAEERIDEILEKLNLSPLKHSMCGHLSAGEAMRVSLAKAVAKRPFVVLADEPTGQLDTENMKLLHSLMREVTTEGTSVIVATHDVRFQSLSDRSVMILDGKLATEEESVDLLMQHRDIERLIASGPITRNVVLDSNNHIRLPSPVVKGLSIGRRATISFDAKENHAVIRRHPDDFEVIRKEEGGDIQQKSFSRKNIKEDNVVVARGLSKSYKTAGIENHIISDLNLEINKGEFLVLLGPSGVGKTTILSMIAGLEEVSSGELSVLGHRFDGSSLSFRSSVRLDRISFLTQNYILHPYLSVTENITLANYLTDDTPDLNRVADTLDSLDLTPYANVYPTELSGGQKQRVGLASALEKKGDLFLFDEPTANLDSLLGRTVMNILTDLAEDGKTVIVATHDLMLVQPGYRVLRVGDKRIYEDVIATDEYCDNLRKEFLHS